MKDTIIIGGGLAGLISSIELARNGFDITVIEKKTYPFHRVCGEYISNEVKKYVGSLGLDLNALGVSDINRFQFSSPSGRVLKTKLDLGGFGISRYLLDFELFKIAQKVGVQFILNQTVESVEPILEQNKMGVTLSDGQILESKIVLGAYGKSAKLDKTLQRDFVQKKSPYIGVKHHIKTDFPKDLIALHNFEDGYCGISAIEDDKYCLCYLTTREQLRRFGNIAEMEKEVLCKNPHLNQIFGNAKFLYDRPEVINEFSFAPKTAIENHVLMVGDAAGLITPLCGNGMAMAIHGGKIASELSTKFLKDEISRTVLEQKYQEAWKQQFGQRLWIGRNVQRLFGDVWLSELALSFFKLSPSLLNLVVKSTHGEVV